MISPIPASAQPDVNYPESDGQPMAENTRQFEWIVTIKGNLDALFRNDPNVFVAGDLLWYPVEGDNTTRQAPDALVAFGRPRGDRGSYRQWEEGGIAPQVVFEILSPSNRYGELQRKFAFYDRYGVEEYYIYDPDRNDLTGYLRRDGALKLIDRMDGWVSPRLRVRFDMTGPELVIYRPDRAPFATFLQLEEQRALAREMAQQARAQAEKERERADRLAAQLRALGIDPEA